MTGVVTSYVALLFLLALWAERQERRGRRVAGNAVVYSPGRPIDMTVEVDLGTARLSVRDHGPRIAPEDQARIFQPFERAVSYLNASGFGLGLYIVRQVAEAHGGSVRVESQPGSGCTFTVELPRERPLSA